MIDDDDHSVIEADLLSVTAGQVEEKPLVLLSLRLEPEFSFESYTIALSPQQARRLLDDLSEQFRESVLLRSVDASNAEAKAVLEWIMRAEADREQHDE